MDIASKYQERIYNYSNSCVFRKTKEMFGGLSNMASGFPLYINGITILSSEALYQACRFPHMPDVQRKILSEKSPMTAKMVGKPFRKHTRPDWDNVRTDIMYWCLQVKLAQHFIEFGHLLETTFNKDIVEESGKDPFWGAMRDKQNENLLQGVNALGRLLMKLRQNYYQQRYDMLYVEPLKIPNFLLLDKPIEIIDSRKAFIDYLYKYWDLTKKQEQVITYNNGYLRNTTTIISKQDNIQTEDSIESQICSLITLKPLTAKEILSKLNIDWSISKLASHLKKIDCIEVEKNKRGNKYIVKSLQNNVTPQQKLFQ